MGRRHQGRGAVTPPSPQVSRAHARRPWGAGKSGAENSFFNSNQSPAPAAPIRPPKKLALASFFHAPATKAPAARVSTGSSGHGTASEACRPNQESHKTKPRPQLARLAADAESAPCPHPNTLGPLAASSRAKTLSGKPFTVIITTADRKTGALGHITTATISNCAAGGSIVSNSTVAAPAGERLPTVPQNFAATPGDGQTTLHWDAPASAGSSPITGYYVLYNMMGCGGSHLVPGCSPTKSTQCTISGLDNGTSYEFRVRAANAVGKGDAPPRSSRHAQWPRQRTPDRDLGPPQCERRRQLHAPPRAPRRQYPLHRQRQPGLHLYRVLSRLRQQDLRPDECHHGQTGHGQLRSGRHHQRQPHGRRNGLMFAKAGELWLPGGLHGRRQSRLRFQRFQRQLQRRHLLQDERHRPHDGHGQFRRRRACLALHQHQRQPHRQRRGNLHAQPGAPWLQRFLHGQPQPRLCL
ncbi:hypothetical protein EII20_08060 [Comamonadaceae bacterium OH2545_COT-014]|nr:hypothetical protein EII20_08060 [Comamonadaceae bacterium OH2545_COT-014]